jgi:thioredoxin-like negative regulator of GroEL
MAIVKVTDSNFDENIQSGVKLVDFWATWCGLSSKFESVTFTIAIIANPP